MAPCNRGVPRVFPVGYQNYRMGPPFLKVLQYDAHDRRRREGVRPNPRNAKSDIHGLRASSTRGPMNQSQKSNTHVPVTCCTSFQADKPLLCQHLGRKSIVKTRSRAKWRLSADRESSASSRLGRTWTVYCTIINGVGKKTDRACAGGRPTAI